MVIMGKLLTPGQCELWAQAQATLRMVQTADGGAGADRRNPRPPRSIGHSTDIYGEPVMKLRVEVPRKSRRAAERRHVRLGLPWSPRPSPLILLIIVLNRVVLEPLARVTRHAVSIGEGTDLTARLHLAGADEIARLAREFDRMVARVAEGRRQLVDQSFQAGFANSPRACCTISAMP